MKILLLSFYYKPDLSAGSFRSAALVGALKRKMPEGSTIDIVTSLPNRYLAGFGKPDQIRMGMTT